MFDSLLIANRGEIACRIIRSAQQLGVRTIAIHTEADANARHVRLADAAVNLGSGPAAENYLNSEKIIEAALSSGAQAIHPGYGFLAENADFVRQIAAAGLTFVGPSAPAIAAMGEKVTARRFAIEAGVPLAPGTDGPVASAAEVEAFGAAHGYPLLIKASHGGGGRGMRRVDSAVEVAEQFEAARREAQAAFGNDEVYAERYLVNARHIEVQVLADASGNAYWLGDRDCSVQRRHQKLIEEAPAPGLPEATRQAMGEAAVRLAEAVGYTSAGTVEFLYEDGQFYFLEMNTRIQVEHPVTEEVLGIDLVAEQLKIAAGEPTSITASGPAVAGVAIEVRLNAEDTQDGLFLPAPGVITTLELPEMEGLRFDTGYEAGDEIPPYYDSLIGKLIVHAATRDQAIDALLDVLHKLRVEGVPTTAALAAEILAHPDFRGVRHSTRWLEETVLSGSNRHEAQVMGRYYTIPVFADQPVVSGATNAVPAQPSQPSSGGRPRARKARGSQAFDGTIAAPMQGTITTVAKEVGESVAEGELLFVLEAMKMENPVKAPAAGTLTEILVTVGESVAAGTELAKVG